MTKIFGWDEQETKSFLEFVFQNKDKTFLWIFENFAKKNSRGELSVRNYFYRLCKSLKQNKVFAEKLGVNEEKKKILFSKHFNEEDEVFLLKKILPTQNQKSVRKACLRLANGDAFLMARFQNKFRHLLKHKPNLVKSVMRLLNGQGIETRNPFKNQNVVLISAKNELATSDFQSLFAGILKLIQNDITKKVELKTKNERQVLSSKLENAENSLRQKQLEFENLEKENFDLKQKFEALSKSFDQNKKQTESNLKEIKNLLHSKNLQKLESFFEKLETTENQQVF